MSESTAYGTGTNLLEFHLSASSLAQESHARSNVGRKTTSNFARQPNKTNLTKDESSNSIGSSFCSDGGARKTCSTFQERSRYYSVP